MKNKMKMTAILLAAILLSLSVLTGCGGGSGSQQESKTETAEPAAETAEPAEAAAETAETAEPAAETAEPAEAAAEPEATQTSSAKPTAEDAQKYVKAVLDVMCTGDYDHSVMIADIEEGKEAEFRDQAISDAVEGIAGDAGLSDEVKEEFKEVLTLAFEKSKYTVGEATPTDDGGYDVVVIIEPLKIFYGADAKMEEEITAMSETTDFSQMSDEEINNMVYLIMAKIIRENLENPVYGEPQEVTVHYGLLDPVNNLYGVSEEDGNALGTYIFSDATE